MENSTFFERILSIIKHEKIESVNVFAKEYLSYSSSEKINRLKFHFNKPSIDIIIDIITRFDFVSAEWLLTGKGSMIKSSENIFSKTDLSKNMVFLTTLEDLNKHNKSLIKEAIQEYQNSKDNDKLYYVNQVAKKLGKSYYTVKKLVDSGHIKSTKNGLITHKSLNEYLSK